MLTRFVRTQLIIFTIASIIGVTVMVVGYLQAPTLLGFGHITVKLELPASGGLYRFANVTYRGVQVGRVTDVEVIDGRRVQATLSLDASPKIPSVLKAQVRSVSPVGEQYVDLQPPNDSPPYLRDGSVIAMSDTSIPQPVGPLLDQLSGLTNSIPQDRLSALLDESFKAFNGAGYDFGSLLDSSAAFSEDLNGVADRVATLVDDGVPLLDSQVQSSDDLRVLSRSLAGITDEVAHNDPQLRTLLQTGPGFAQEVARLLDQLKPTLPILLANLTTVGQVAFTYNASLEQLLVLLPPGVANNQAALPVNNPVGLPVADFAAMVGDQPACTVGFLPPSEWRSPNDLSDIDTPDGLYCKLPQDSPIAVRGARNYPCVEHPGKRAPTVELCNSEQGYQPLAMRQHALGPYPIDPNLVAQGIPPDSRILPGSNIYGPIEGTPLPPPVAPPPATGATGNAGETPPSAPAAPPSDSPAPLAPAAAPSSYGGDGTELPPSVAFAKYNPQTGAYMAPDGQMYSQSDLASSATPKAWTDLVLGPQ
jgi:phospholipid/cholesterol/gamma-HCH transport system substrate-binding protein